MIDEHNITQAQALLQFAVRVIQDGQHGVFTAESNVNTEKLSAMLNGCCHSVTLFTTSLADFKKKVTTCGEDPAWDVYTTEYTKENKMADCATMCFNQRCDFEIFDPSSSMLIYAAISVILLILICIQKCKTRRQPLRPLLWDLPSARYDGSSPHDPENPDDRNSCVPTDSTGDGDIA